MVIADISQSSAPTFAIDIHTAKSPTMALSPSNLPNDFANPTEFACPRTSMPMTSPLSAQPPDVQDYPEISHYSAAQFPPYICPPILASQSRAIRQDSREVPYTVTPDGYRGGNRQLPPLAERASTTYASGFRSAFMFEGASSSSAVRGLYPPISTMAIPSPENREMHNGHALDSCRTQYSKQDYTMD